MSESGEYGVTQNNIHLESSFKVRKDDCERELAALREQHPDSQVWNRSVHRLAQARMGGAQRFLRDGDLPEPDRPHGLELATAVVCPTRVRYSRQDCVAIYQMIISTLWISIPSYRKGTPAGRSRRGRSSRKRSTGSWKPVGLRPRP